MDALGIEWTLLLAQIVNFAILIVLLRMFLYQPVLNMLNARKERIAQSMKDAERVSAAAREAEQDKAKVLEQARREAQEIRAQATRDAEKIAQDVRGRAEQEATDIRMKSQADAAKQVELALADANKQIADLAILATEKLLGRELANKAEQQRFLAEFLADPGSKGK
ncbi:MAG: F0F1 ATP synthase subunit B [Caldilinea sp.]|uniref:F0F1 ATP synthase subunit B n=1 Tax=Caldilinea sp. TaxID=2293560 RepID=UPI002BDA880B|nr:F0F1 ATP synthase subunit B [Anaerolineales bacterium]HQY92112.1 F0F1 ATP synthase subunit B [Caldilinea sp.]HRA66597.1 F0F1 ATP synthase subunit B [Caldilinea sp.]